MSGSLFSNYTSGTVRVQACMKPYTETIKLDIRFLGNSAELLVLDIRDFLIESVIQIRKLVINLSSLQFLRQYSMLSPLSVLFTNNKHVSTIL